MRTVELRRHSFTKKGEARGRGSHLSPEGVRAARRVGAASGPFDHVLASTSPRTSETVIAMGHAVDELFEMPSPVETGVVEFHAWRAWPDPFGTFRQLAQESQALDAYLSRQVERLLGAVRGIDDGGRVLVVGHGGWLEAVVAGLVGPVPAAGLGGSFWHLDGVRLAITGDADGPGSVSVEAVHRYQQPLMAGRRPTHSNVRNGKRLVWYTENLWPSAAELPVFEIRLDEVKASTGEPALDQDCWFGGRGATLRQVAKHSARIEAATFEHPIILNDDGSLMDGGHRLCRALLDGRSTIAAVRFPTMPPADEVHDLESE